MEVLKCLEVLGLKKGYNEVEIKKNYRSLARKYHPDLYRYLSKKGQEQLEEKMKEVYEAYETLEKNNYPFSSFGSQFSSNVNSNNFSFSSRNDLIKKDW